MKKSMMELGEKVSAEDRIPGPQMLTHDENLRANALALACRYYVETIVKDGDLYREMVRDNRVLKPATYMGVIEVAFNFEAYINGELQKDLAAICKQTEPITAAKKALEEDADRPAGEAT
jgi:hypothetical protein